MKKIFICIFLTHILWTTTDAQDTISYLLRNYLDEYISGMNQFFESEEMDKGFNFERFFFTAGDTLFWPDNYNQEDLLFKHRLGPQEAFSKFRIFKEKSSDLYSYSKREAGTIKQIKYKSGRYFDKYRIYFVENHIFNTNDFFGGTDSIAYFRNYYDIISWFNPSSKDYTYEYRINKIYENQASSWIVPHTARLMADFIIPDIRENTLKLTGSGGYGVSLKADWILGGKGFFTYNIQSGLGLSSFWFKTDKASHIFKDHSLVDKDCFPFTLISNLSDFQQSLSFKTLNVPVQLLFTKFFPHGKYSTGLFGGINLHMTFGKDLNVQSGDITYSGKYKFSFASDSILLENLPSYNFRKFPGNEIKSPDLSLNRFFVSAQLGGEFNWYLGKNLIANFSLAYQTSLTPFYKNSGQTLTYNYVKKGDARSFEPSLNPFLALSEKGHLDSWKVGVGINYILEKPVIPFGKVGYKDKILSRIIKDKMVLGAGSISQGSRQKTLLLSVVDTVSTRNLSGQRIPYRYIGPTPNYFRQGKISSSARGGVKLTFQVPSNNKGASLFLEEPYGYNIIMDNSLDIKPGGMYGEIKVIGSNKIWSENETTSRLEINFSRLNPLQIYLVNYKFSFDDAGMHHDKILGQLREDIEKSKKLGLDFIVYFVSDQPQAFVLKSNDPVDEFFESIDIKLKNTDDVLSDIGGLKGFLNANNINPRREISLHLFATEEFLDFGKQSVEEFPKILNIDSKFVKVSTHLYSYGRTQSLFFEKSLKYLRKIGIINE